MTELQKDRQGKSSIAPTFSKRGYKNQNENPAKVTKIILCSSPHTGLLNMTYDCAHVRSVFV